MTLYVLFKLKIMVLAYTINPDVTVQSLQRDYPDNYKILLVIPESNYNAYKS